LSASLALQNLIIDLRRPRPRKPRRPRRARERQACLGWGGHFRRLKSKGEVKQQLVSTTTSWESAFGRACLGGAGGGNWPAGWPKGENGQLLLVSVTQTVCVPVGRPTLNSLRALFPKPKQRAKRRREKVTQVGGRTTNRTPEEVENKSSGRDELSPSLSLRRQREELEAKRKTRSCQSKI